MRADAAAEEAENSARQGLSVAQAEESAMAVLLEGLTDVTSSQEESEQEEAYQRQAEQDELLRRISFLHVQLLTGDTSDLLTGQFRCGDTFSGSLVQIINFLLSLVEGKLDLTFRQTQHVPVDTGSNGSQQLVCSVITGLDRSYLLFSRFTIGGSVDVRLL